MKKSVKTVSRGINKVFVAAWFIYGIIFTAGGYILTQNVILSGVLAMGFGAYAAFEYRKKYEKKNIEKLEKEFLEAMTLVLASVSSGKAIEQAFVELSGNMEKEGKNRFRLIYKEIDRINKRTAMNYSFYDELVCFGEESGSGDVLNIVRAMKIVGTKGGNMAYIIRSSLAGLRVKLETDDEIRQTLALPQYNQKIITVMPFALVLMIKSISKEYIEVLYTTRQGTIVVVGVCLVMFVAWILGIKLCKIEV